MGWFSSKKKTKVHTSVQRMVEDNQLPESAKSAVISAIMRDGSISDHLLENFIASIALRAERMYEYAEKGRYSYGLPVSDLINNIQGKDVVAGVVRRMVGKDIQLGYYQFAPLNSLHVGWQTLVDQYGYQSSSNEIQALSAQYGVPVYLDDMFPVYTQETFDEAEPGTLDHWGVSPKAGFTPERAGSLFLLQDYTGHSPYRLNPKATQDYVEVRYVYEVELLPATEFEPAVKEIRRGSFNVPVVDSHPEEDGEYHQIQYRYTTIDVPADPRTGTPQQSTVHTKYWTYLQGSNEIPEIEAIYKTRYDKMGTYFPWIYYRHDKLNRSASRFHDTDEYKSSVRLAKYLGIDYQFFTEAIHENPDIHDIEQAMTIMAVAANSTDEVDCRYLFEYFNLLYYNSLTPLQQTGLSFSAYQPFSARSGQSISIRDKEFHILVKYQGIGRRRVAGKIGKIGTHSGGVDNITIQEEYQDNGETQTTQIRDVKIPFHYYRKQVNDTFYEEVSVFNLRVTYDIWRGKSFTAKATGDQLLIPLDRSITRLFSLPDREVLYARSLHNIFNTRITTKSKWYQSGWFKVVMWIVVIVITIVTWGTYTGPALAAMAALSGAALAYAIVMAIVKMVVISVAVKLFVKEVGAEVGFIVAVLAIAYGGYNMLASSQAAWAPNLVAVGNSMTSAVNEEYGRMTAQYMGEQQAFNLFVDERNKELEEAKKLLQTSTTIDPFEFIGQVPMIRLGESPDDYYSRTVHSGNIGIVGIDAVSSFVDVALTLPTLQDTLDFFN